MKKTDAIGATRGGAGVPFALCDNCAALYTAAFPLKRVEYEAGKKVTCENCRKRSFGGMYVREKLK